VRLQLLGRSDLRVSRVGLGCNNFGWRVDLEQTRRVVDAALDAGINFLDTADIYGGRGESERFLGEVLRGRWDRVVLATKFGMDMGDGAGARGAPEYVRRSVDGSLSRLGTDRIDLYYYHRPDGVTPLAETLGALDGLVREGKIRYAGCSNFDAALLAEAEAAPAETRFVAVQNEYSLLDRTAEDEALPAARRLGLAFVPYFPLASGLLTGKYRRGEPAPAGTRLEGRDDRLTDAVFDRLEAFDRFAAERGRSLLELAIAGLASEPGVASVIAGATSAEQVRANAAAADWDLGPAELDELRAL